MKNIYSRSEFKGLNEKATLTFEESKEGIYVNTKNRIENTWENNVETEVVNTILQLQHNVLVLNRDGDVIANF